MSLITSIARAIGGGTTENAGTPAEPGAEASITETTTMEEVPMSIQTAAPGAATIAGIPEADHKAAVAGAEADGKAAGRKEASDRMAAILGADGIKGDGGRMAAALDLAAQSPDMAAEGVVSFVTANVPAAKADAGATYEQERLASAGLTQPAGGGASAPGKSGLSAAIDRHIATLKRPT